MFFACSILVNHACTHLNMRTQLQTQAAQVVVGIKSWQLSSHALCCCVFVCTHVGMLTRRLSRLSECDASLSPSLHLACMEAS